MSQSQSSNDGLVHQLEADDGNEGDGELVRLIIRGSADESICSLSRNSGNKWKDDGEEGERLRDWEGQVSDLSVCIAVFW